MGKLLKKAGWWLLGLLFLLLAISFLLPSDFTAESRQTIRAPVHEVFGYVEDLRSWKEWAPWDYFQPGVELSYSNPPMGEGAYCHWVSQNKDIGQGKVTLANVAKYQRITAVFDEEEKHLFSLLISFTESDGKTQVAISRDRYAGWNPVKRYSAIFWKSSTRKVFRRGLHSLENLAVEEE